MNDELIPVAVLDDNALLLDALARALPGLGLHVVLESHSPADFLELIGGSGATVAVIGQHVWADPARSGTRSLVADLVARHPALKVVVLSALSRLAEAEECRQEGAHAVLWKASATCDALASAIEAVRRGERWFPSRAFSVKGQAAPGGLNRSAITAREREVLVEVARGVANEDIGVLLRVRARTVKAHVASLYRKLGAENRVQLAIIAWQLGVGSPRANEPSRHVGRSSTTHAAVGVEGAGADGQSHFPSASSSSDGSNGILSTADAPG